MTDQDIIDAAARRYVDGETISDGEARVIASQWHGGQASALYALTSTGAISDTTEMEIERESRALPARDCERFGLDALYGYVLRTGARGPVAGWSALWGAR